MASWHRVFPPLLRGHEAVKSLYEEDTVPEYYEYRDAKGNLRREYRRGAVTVKGTGKKGKTVKSAWKSKGKDEDERLGQMLWVAAPEDGVAVEQEYGQVQCETCESSEG